MREADNWMVVDWKRNEVKLPAHLPDFRGITWLVQGISKLPGQGSSGKLSAFTDNGASREFFPTVFGLEIVKRVPVPQLHTQDL